MICVGLELNHYVVLTGSPPCGTGSLVVVTQDEFATLAASPWNLSLSEGGLVAVAIVGVWGVGFCVRALVRVLSSGDSSTEN